MIFREAENLFNSSDKPIIVFECSEEGASAVGLASAHAILSFLINFGYVIKQISFGNWASIPNN